MEFDVKKVKVEHKHVQKAAGDAEASHPINLYQYPPYGQLTMDECEDLFRQRLEALNIMEGASELYGNNLAIFTNKLREIKSYVYKTNCILTRTIDPQQKKLDQFSHMLVRMYCISNPGLKPWFKTCEKKLLLYRLRDQASSLSGGQLEDILRSFNFEFERVTGSDLSDLYRENLVGWTKREQDRDNVIVFKVRFVYALNFIAKRSVALKDGYAYLTRSEIISVICDVFVEHLEGELNFGRQHMNPELVQLQKLLESLSLVYKDYVERLMDEKRMLKREQDGANLHPYRIDLDRIDVIKKEHYPPCMRVLQDALEEDHHLRHQGRVYYGAFLRSGHVDMDTAIEFFRKEFTKKISGDRFERDYKYNIRHLYGREGHKKALSCFGCDKIINDNAPGPADKHGCPFKHSDGKHLRKMLAAHGINEVDIENIAQQASDKQYTKACSTYFQSKRGVTLDEPFKTPIGFYSESMRIANRPPQETTCDTVDDRPDAEMTDDFGCFSSH